MLRMMASISGLKAPSDQTRYEDNFVVATRYVGPLVKPSDVGRFAEAIRVLYEYWFGIVELPVNGV